MAIKFFLGANTPKGFASFYDDFILSKEKVYIIKSGPGSGKSSFMKEVSNYLTDEQTEYIHCSGDVHSLDGVYLPKQKAAIVDGTAPHVVEPFNPLAVEEYLHLGKFSDGKAFRNDKKNAAQLIARHKQAYSRVYRCLSANNSLGDDLLSFVLHPDSLQKIARRAKGIIRREIAPGKGGEFHKRYLNAITPQGETCFWETVAHFSKRVYCLENDFGLSHFMLAPILNAALEAGQTVYACYNPLCADERLEHLILPELSLAFVSVNDDRKYPNECYRRIRLNATVPPDVFKTIRLRIRLLRKTSKAILHEARAALGEAKELHDKIEKLYQPYVDFEGIYNLAEQFSQELIGID